MELIRLLLMLSACTGLVFGQSFDAWAALSKHAGKKVTVSTTDGQQRSGKLLRIEPERIVLQEDGALLVSIARNSVRTVVRERSRNKAGWIAGLSAAGFGTGFLIGFRAFDDATFAERKILATAVAGAGAGGVMGYLISRGGRKQETIYQTP